MVEEKLNKALDFFKKNNYKEAMSVFKEILQADENNPNLINNIALCEMKLGQSKNAEENFLKSIKLDETAPQPYLNLAELYFSQQEILKALDLLQKATRIMPDNVAILHYFARICIEDRRIDEAIDSLNMVIELSPENIDAYWDLGMIYYDMGEYELASKNFENVLEKNQNSAIIFYQTALSYEMQDNIDKAISNHLKALSVDESFPLPYKRLGMMFMARQEFEDAKEYFEDYIKFDIPTEEKENIQKLLDRISK